MAPLGRRLVLQQHVVTMTAVFVETLKMLVRLTPTASRKPISAQPCVTGRAADSQRPGATLVSCAALLAQPAQISFTEYRTMSEGVMRQLLRTAQVKRMIVRQF
jgi:hypothetical protein